MENKLKPDYKLQKPNLKRRKFDDFNLDDVFKSINYDMLYLRFFNLKKTQDEKMAKMQKDLSELKKEIIENKIIIPRGICKIFKASCFLNLIIIKNDDGQEIDRIETMKNSKGFFVSDYVGEDDYIGLTSVSVFIKDDTFQNLLGKKDFAKLYMINSLAIMSAEAFTEILHKQINVDFGIENLNDLNSFFSKISGKRYSPGYPVLDISANKKIYDLLNAKEIGSSITDSFMIEPESSVQSLILHNPKSEY